MTDNYHFVSRRERRLAKRGRVAVSAGRTATAALAASGLVVTGGVAANASTAPSSDEGRDFSTVELNTSELNVERASQTEEVAVSASDEAELAFERPVVSTQAAPQPEPQTAEAVPAAQTTDQGATQQAQTQEAPAQQAQGQQTQTGQTQGQQVEQTQTEQTGATAAASTETESAPEAPSNAGGGSVVGAAYSYLGIPWSQMDCSATVQAAYASAGISVPRTTHGQMTLPQVSSPQPGDIVISNGGSHAAIYVGNGQVISSTSSQGIRVHGLHEGWHNVNSYHRPG